MCNPNNVYSLIVYSQVKLKCNFKPGSVQSVISWCAQYSRDIETFDTVHYHSLSSTVSDFAVQSRRNSIIFSQIISVELYLTYWVKQGSLRCRSSAPECANLPTFYWLPPRPSCNARHAPSAGEKWRPWPLTDPIAQNQRKWRHAKSIAARESGYLIALPISNVSAR